MSVRGCQATALSCLSTSSKDHPVDTRGTGVHPVGISCFFFFIHIGNLLASILAFLLIYVKILKALVYYIQNYVSYPAFFYLLKLFKQQKHFTC